MVKKFFSFVILLFLFINLNLGCGDGSSSNEPQEPSLPHDWLGNFEEVDSGNRNLEEIVQNLGNTIPVERTVRIKHSSTDIDSSSVEFKYDVLVVNNDVPRSAPLSMGVVRAKTFAAEFLRESNYGNEPIEEVLIRINSEDNSLDVGKSYTGVLKIEKGLYDQINSEAKNDNVSVSIKHLMIRETRSLYSFEI